MIRLTLLLLVGIGVTMSIAGRDIERPQGSDQPGGDVARLDNDLNSGPVGPSRLALSDERGAIEAALAATRSPISAAEAATRTPEAETAEPVPEARVIQASASVEPSEPWVVTGNVVNLRQGPSTSTAVIGQVTRGDRAEVLEEASGGWLRIRTQASTGYIYGKFLAQQQG